MLLKKDFEGGSLSNIDCARAFRGASCARRNSAGCSFRARSHGRPGPDQAWSAPSAGGWGYVPPPHPLDVIGSPRGVTVGAQTIRHDDTSRKE
jgi:hypothetical protein